MKNILNFLLIVMLVSSCTTQSSNGQLIGASNRPMWFQTDPYGMLYVPGGAFNMGQSDQDVPNNHSNETKTVSVAAFYMDQTEITNNEYRQFVNWVKDSIARRILGEEFPDLFLIPTYDDDLSERDQSEWALNWNERFRYNSFNPEKGQNEEYAVPLAKMFLSQSERFYNRKEIDTRELMFEYYWIDLQEAAKKGRPLIKRLSYQAAESSAALLVFKDAFERAQSFDTKKVRDALAATDMQTFYGNIKFAAGGQNVSKPMVLFQVSCNDDGSKCENKVVAPTKWASAELVHPIPSWSKR